MGVQHTFDLFQLRGFYTDLVTDLSARSPHLPDKGAMWGKCGQMGQQLPHVVDVIRPSMAIHCKGIENLLIG